jgi:hypothetical protein
MKKQECFGILAVCRVAGIHTDRPVVPLEAIVEEGAKAAVASIPQDERA